jgi:hypothetical protein
LHPELPGEIVGEARAGVNNKSRSHHPEMVSACKDGEQYILFKKIYRHNTPLLFSDDGDRWPIKMCDSALWKSGKPERWVRWLSKYLRDKSVADGMDEV